MQATATPAKVSLSQATISDGRLKATVTVTVFDTYPAVTVTQVKCRIVDALHTHVWRGSCDIADPGTATVDPGRTVGITTDATIGDAWPSSAYLFVDVTLQYTSTTTYQPLTATASLPEAHFTP